MKVTIEIVEYEGESYPMFTAEELKEYVEYELGLISVMKNTNTIGNNPLINQVFMDSAEVIITEKD